ncbi:MULTISPECIES: SDR family NAD(P)-dependent oxidoreductase [unclassified Streptomyces]|uniref:SDR family NAD(P)-dependent oxidoreductase n=1 Tax=unclassified Streptomyces TaxID=2593676 RepID=UPI002DD96683|nr:SDR family NAD(P)-dependent oxidoreductase [Streptomyces sp. NBC_01445]WSE02314.1 SDR family NAD(P)-dependent oxidoreductase [Streptomyces sp. NBC_01445]
MSKTVLITGASTGMGEALTFEYVERGWNVAATMRDTARANPAFADLDTVLVTALDVTDRAGIDKAVHATIERFGAIDAVVNAAGYGQLGAVEEVSIDQLRDQYETNVVGVVQVIQAVLPHMRERGTGHIVNVGSMGGHVSLPTMAVYCSSKSALQNLTEGLAWELGPLGIHVTLVEPAGFNTNFTASSKFPATSIADYADSYATMAEFDKQAVRGDLVKSMAAVADIAGTDKPPLHLAVAPAALEMVRGRFTELMAEYDRWEPVTAATL